MFYLRLLIRNLIILLLIGVNPIRRNHNEVIILSFHDIPKLQYQWFFDLIKTINSKYELISPQSIIDFPLSSKSRKIKVILSFDDGFKSSFDLANWVDQKYGIKSAFFVCAGFIGLSKKNAQKFFINNMVLSKIRYYHDVVPMNWLEVRKLHNNGHLIGAHTYNHPILCKLNEKEVGKELEKSNSRLQKELGILPSWFAYPFGNPRSISTLTAMMVKKYYKFCFTNVRGSMNESPCSQLLFRQNVKVGEPYKIVVASIEGKLDILSFKSRNFLCNLVKSNF